MILEFTFFKNSYIPVLVCAVKSIKQICLSVFWCVRPRLDSRCISYCSKTGGDIGCYDRRRTLSIQHTWCQLSGFDLNRFSLDRLDTPVSGAWGSGKCDGSSSTGPCAGLCGVTSDIDDLVSWWRLVTAVICYLYLSQSTALGSNSHSTVAVNTDTTACGIVLSVISSARKLNGKTFSCKRFKILCAVCKTKVPKYYRFLELRFLCACDHAEPRHIREYHAQAQNNA